jgi:hypothetical protein
MVVASSLWIAEATNGLRIIFASVRRNLGPFKTHLAKQFFQTSVFQSICYYTRICSMLQVKYGRRMIIVSAQPIT